MTRLGVGTAHTPLARFATAFTVTVTNPKLILFFVAFVPQFLSTAASFVQQASVYILTFDIMAMINASVYAFLARSAGRRLTHSRTQMHVSYASGGILIAAGLLVLALRQK